jgi:hypothetical protein
MCLNLPLFQAFTISLFATILRKVNILLQISFFLILRKTTATNALFWTEMPTVENVKIQKVCQKCEYILLFFPGIPEVISSKIKESKRFMLIMSKNVATDPACIWSCAVAVEEAIRGQNLKQLISIYPRDRKKVRTCVRTP